ncbi:HEAT repeat domain-containing protein [Myxococcus fulvus]|uniref:HEAT repeat domain-containing protein n=1 Tax=Myxococcus fulvus TaxID=33 RepID=UPI003B9D7B29
MNTRKTLLGGAALALLLCAAAWMALGPEPLARASPVDEPLQFRFPKGQRWTYRLDYAADSRVQLSGQGKQTSLAGQVRLVGDLVLRGHGAQGVVQRVGLRLENWSQHSLRVLGQELLPDASAVDAVFQGREALLEVDPDGVVRAVSFREEDPSLFKNTVQSLVGELQVVLREGATWSVEEATSRGRARTEYSRVGEDAAAVRLLKRRAEYVELKGLGQGGAVRLVSRFEADVAREGVLDRVDGEETVERLGAGGDVSAASQVRVSLVRSATGHFEPGEDDLVAASALQRLAPGTMVVDPKVRAQMLTQQVDGMTADRLFTLLEQFANLGTLPDHNHFLLQATGLLEQQPELCARLVELFRRPTLQVKGRALLLDLLAGTGTPEAQVALVQALSSREAAGEARYDMLLSRLSLVSHPTSDTVRFAERTYASMQGALRVASTYTLGSTAGALYRQEKSPEAWAAVQRLAEDLRASKAPEEQAHFLMALGNAGVVEQTEVISGYAGSPSPEVRRASAKALRKMATPEATLTLLSLAADTQSPVQATAMESLGRRPLDTGLLMDLRDLALSGGVKVENYHVFVSLVAPYLETEPDVVRELLRHLLTQEVPDRQVLTRIRGLLET